MGDVVRLKPPQYKGEVKKSAMRYLTCTKCRGSLFEIDDKLSVWCIGCNDLMWNLRVEEIL